MRPIIGIMPLWDEARQTVRMHPGYPDSVMASGGTPIVLPFTTDPEQQAQLADLCDGFIFPGGQDVSPSVYGEQPFSDLVVCCEKRDALESAMLKLVMERNKPILAICRGLQFLNASLGGTLYQDLPTFLKSDIAHNQSAPTHEPSHPVSLGSGTPLQKQLGLDEAKVNSFHHQGIEKLADGLEPMAIAGDGLIESFFRPDSRFLWAVQWHPEMMFFHDENSRKIFKAFIDACM